MAKSKVPAQELGEVRAGLVMYPGGKTWHYCLKWRGKVRKGDTKCAGIGAARTWLEEEKKLWPHEEHGGKRIPTLRATWEEWARLQRGQVEDLYIVNMRSSVEVHAAPYLDLPLTALDNASILTIRATYLQTQGRGYRTGQDWESARTHSDGGANTVVKMLSALCGWAVVMGRIPARPFRVKKLDPQPHPEGVVWPEQVQPFLAEADQGGPQRIAKDPAKAALQVRPLPHSATAIRLMIGLGLREDEALGSRWEWWDRRQGAYTVGEAKDRALRTIPVPEWLAGHLEGLRTGREAGLILPADDGRPHHKNFTQKPVARVCRILDIQDVTPHRLRATFATAHFESGTTPNQIQLMLGHEDIQTTMKYIVQRSKDQAEAQARVAEAMGFHRVTEQAR